MLGYERSKVRRTFITFFWYRCGGWNRSGRSLRRKIFRVGHFEQKYFWPMTPFEVLKTSCWKWNFKFRGVARNSGNSEWAKNHNTIVLNKKTKTCFEPKMSWRHWKIASTMEKLAAAANVQDGRNQFRSRKSEPDQNRNRLSARLTRQDYKCRRKRPDG